MQNQEYKYLRDAFICYIEKLLSAIGSSNHNSAWLRFKQKVLDPTVAPFDIYLEAQKTEILVNPSPQKLVPAVIRSTPRLSRQASMTGFSALLLKQAQAAQAEIRLNTESFTNVFNKVQENVCSSYMSREQYERYLSSQENHKELQKLREVRSTPSSYTPNYKLLDRVDSLLADLHIQKQAMK